MHTLSIPTPAGTLTAIVDDDGTVRAAGFVDDARPLVERLGLDDSPPAGHGGPVVAAVERYLSGDLDALGSIPTRQPGTDFQQQVWEALQAIPPGEPCSYGDLAERVGRPGATRAVGTACGRNLVAPFVPCHRVVRADGTAGGYLYGPATKTWLLAHESGQK